MGISRLWRARVRAATGVRRSPPARPPPESGSVAMLRAAPRVSPSIAAITALLALLTADILAGASQVEAIALGLLAFVFALWLARLARSWTVIVGTIACVILLLP